MAGNIRKEIQNGTILELISYDSKQCYKFEIVECMGMGAEFIAYKAKSLDSVGTNYCVLKELFPFSMFKNSGLRRAEDGINIADKHNATLLESYTVENNIVQEIEKVKSITTVSINNRISVRGIDDVLKSNSTYYIKVPYDGENTLSAKAKSLKDALEITREVAVMTQGLHNSGYLHLDIKPGNILFNQIDINGNLGVPRLNFLDMGSFIKKDDLEEKNYSLSSSAGFSAPEQRFEHSVDSDCPETADIYSVGAILFGMVMGKEPTLKDNDCCEFDFSGSEIVADQHIYIKNELNKLFMNTLSGEPSDRYKSSSELIEQIDKILSALPSSQGYEALKSNKFEISESGFKWENEKEEYVYSLFKTISYNNKSYKSLFELMSELTYAESADKKFFLVGPGADGKSSQLKRLCCDAVKGYYPFGYAPIYITSKDIRNIPDDYSGSLLDKAIEKKLNLTEDSQIVSEGLLIIIDGFNELNGNQQRRIETALEIAKDSENIFIVSGRNCYEFAEKGFKVISVNSLSEETVRKESGYDFDKYYAHGLIEFLANNIFILKKLRDLKDKNRKFETPSDILSYYYDVQINELVYSLKKSREQIAENKSAYESKIKRAITSAAFAAYDVMSLSVKDKDFGLDLQTERDFVDEIKKVLFQSDLGKFEHDLIRDFIVADALKESVELCCEKNSAEYLDGHFSEELSDDVLKLLGELLEENKLSEKAKKEALKNYNNYCLKLTEGFWEKFINGTPDVCWDNKKCQKQYSLTYVLYLVKNKADKETLKFNLIRAVVLGRGCKTLQGLLYMQVPAFKKKSSTVYTYMKKRLKIADCGLQKLLASLLIDSFDIDKYSMSRENIRYSDYVGQKAKKRRWMFNVSVTAIVMLLVSALLALWYLFLPQPIIQTYPTWVGEQNIYSSSSTLNVWFTVKESNSNTILLRSYVKDDFEFEGFDAEITYENKKDGKTYIYLNNIKPVAPNSEGEVGHCKLILKKNTVYCEDGINRITNQKGNKETVVAEFDTYFSDTGSVECFVGNHFRVIKEGFDGRMHICFASHEKFESNFSTDDMVFHNFSADTVLKEFCSGEKMPEDLVKFAKNFFDEIDILKEYEYVYFYELELKNIYPTDEGERYIEFLNKSVVNYAGVLANQNTSETFEIYEIIDTITGNIKPKIFCEMVSSNVIPVGGALRIDVRFFLSYSIDGSYLQSNLTKDKIQLNGFKADVYISNTVENNAHYYAIFLSNVVPEEETSEYSISFLPGCAVSDSVEFNDRKDVPLAIIFTDEIIDVTPPELIVETPYFVGDTLAFGIDITDDSVLNAIDKEQITKNIMLINATYNDIFIQYVGGRDTYSYRFQVNILGVSIVNPNEEVLLQILPQAICDSSGNPSGLIQKSVLWSDYYIKEYVDISKVPISPEIVILDTFETVVDENNCALFKFKTSSFIEKPEINEINNIRFNGMTATTNIKRIRNDPDGWETVKLTDVEITGEYGEVTVWVEDSTTEQIYANKLIVTKSTTE